MLRCLSVLLGGLASAAFAGEPKILFEDHCDGKLGRGWTWLKQNEKDWRFRDGALEFRVQPGQVNVLARTVPDPADGPFSIEVTLTSVAEPTKQYEQVGFFWYANGKQGPKF